MFFRQVLYRDLGCASYMIGDAGEAAVIDPRWSIDVYLETAATERLEITHVIDTHEHADHVSGRPALVQATGAQSHRPTTTDERRPDLIQAGDEIELGSLVIRAIGTPGHRPEHLTFVVIDSSAEDGSGVRDVAEIQHVLMGCVAGQHVDAAEALLKLT